MGRIVEMHAARPFNHASETARWDFRYTIVWKNAAIAHEDFDTDPIIARIAEIDSNPGDDWVAWDDTVAPTNAPD